MIHFVVSLIIFKDHIWIHADQTQFFKLPTIKTKKLYLINPGPKFLGKFL